MAKILIRRTIPADAEKELDELLKQMRSSTPRREGYVSGETLRRVDAPGEILVISTWRSVRDWEEWFNSPERLEIQTKIEMLLTAPTEYAIYEHL